MQARGGIEGRKERKKEGKTSGEALALVKEPFNLHG